MLLAAGVPLKVVSEIMGHATAAFTADVYVTVAEELLGDAATRIAAFVPRRASTGAEMSCGTHPAALPVRQSGWSGRRLGDLNPRRGCRPQPH
jgi:hypothetical protein